MSKTKSNERINRGAYERCKPPKRSIYFDTWSLQKEIKEGTTEGPRGEEDNAFNRECRRCGQTSLIEDNNLCNVCVDDLGGL
jgi:hypothetical protein|tara:strand:+ start:157 stop:402 length:246 start_codon:yes stop_codon:yes gene_type:complete